MKIKLKDGGEALVITTENNQEAFELGHWTGKNIFIQGDDRINTIMLKNLHIEHAKPKVNNDREE